LIARDPTLIAPFLALLAVAATYAQSVRFVPENGVSVLPGIAAAWLALRPAVRLPRPAVGVAVAGLVAFAFLPLLGTYAKLVPDAFAGDDPNEAPEQVPRLERIPVRLAEWPSMDAIHALWRQRGLSGRPVLATNRRNDLTYANGAYLYWFLDAAPAAWITVYDPGLADRDDVQRDVADDLCGNRAPVVEEDQDPSATSNGEFGYADHGSRHLDEFIALNYRSDAVVGFYRLRIRDTDRCVEPDAASATQVRALRERALREDDIPRAAALSILLVERAEAAGTRAEVEDVAGALLGGYWVPDAQLPPEPVRAGLLALRERRAVEGQVDAVTAPAGPLTRLATGTAYVTYRPQAAPGAELQLVARELRETVRESARWPLSVRNLFALEPPSPRLFAFVEASGGAGVALEQARFAFLRQGGDPREALASGLRLVRLEDSRPVEQGSVLTFLADVFDAMGDPACAARARAFGDSVPGVHDTGPEDASAPCAVDLHLPILNRLP
jgi:hypothetical protein